MAGRVSVSSSDSSLAIPFVLESESNEELSKLSELSSVFCETPADQRKPIVSQVGAPNPVRIQSYPQRVVAKRTESRRSVQSFMSHRKGTGDPLKAQTQQLLAEALGLGVDLPAGRPDEPAVCQWCGAQRWNRVTGSPGHRVTSGHFSDRVTGSRSLKSQDFALNRVRPGLFFRKLVKEKNRVTGSRVSWQTWSPRHRVT